MLVEKLIRDALMLWATIDPITTMSIFAALTVGLSPDKRRRTAARAILYSAVILFVSLVIGQLVLAGMELDLLSLQVAGGIILFIFGLQMIFGSDSTFAPEPGHDIAVFPLAVPSIANPGSILAVIILTTTTSTPFRFSWERP